MYTSEGKKIVSTSKAPKAIGPYSQAILTEELIFTAGQVGLIPETMEIIDGGIEAQTEQVLKNISAIIAEASMSLQNTVKCTCFLKDMNDFVAFNSVYEGFFSESPPARETVEVARLPKDVLVEVSAICGK